MLVVVEGGAIVFHWVRQIGDRVADGLPGFLLRLEQRLLGV
jgi:hypothetical protein